jgi:ATP synthase protein I
MKSDPSARPSGIDTNAAVTITSSMIAGMIVYGGLGWLVGRWLGHEALFIAGGALVGITLALYLVNARLRHELPEPGRRDGTDAARGGR